MNLLVRGGVVDPHHDADCRQRNGWFVDGALDPGPADCPARFGTPVAGLLCDPVMPSQQQHQRCAGGAVRVVVSLDEGAAGALRDEAHRALGRVLEQPERGVAEYELSYEVQGLECVLVIPGPLGKKARAFQVVTRSVASRAPPARRPLALASLRSPNPTS